MKSAVVLLSLAAMTMSVAALANQPDTATNIPMFRDNGSPAVSPLPTASTPRSHHHRMSDKKKRQLLSKILKKSSATVTVAPSVTLTEDQPEQPGAYLSIANPQSLCAFPTPGYVMMNQGSSSKLIVCLYGKPNQTYLVDMFAIGTSATTTLTVVTGPQQETFPQGELVFAVTTGATGGQFVQVYSENGPWTFFSADITNATGG